MRLKFTDTGFMISDSSLPLTSGVYEEEFVPFIAEMAINILPSGRALLEFNDRYYSMSARELEAMLKLASVHHGRVLGLWTLVKRGKWLGLRWNPVI